LMLMAQSFFATVLAAAVFWKCHPMEDILFCQQIRYEANRSGKPESQRQQPPTATNGAWQPSAAARRGIWSTAIFFFLAPRVR
jgi:hypothetical protein